MGQLLARMSVFPVELAFAGAMVALATALSITLGLPLLVPDESATSFVGMHYLVPLAGILVWYICSVLRGGVERIWGLTIALLSYALVMWVHFNLKLWAPHINPALHDEFYWRIDETLRPIVDLCLALRSVLPVGAPVFDALYLQAFVAMFFISFCVHAVLTPAVFRRLLTAAIFLQGLGALGYLVAPALGPFVYEQGASALATRLQGEMLDIHRTSLAAGTQFLSQYGSQTFVSGLAAMPSLHAGASYLFLWFAAKHMKPLLWLYVPLFAFILIEAVASRWHYVIDLPIGILLAQCCIWLASRCESMQQVRQEPATRQVMVPTAA